MKFKQYLTEAVSKKESKSSFLKAYKAGELGLIQGGVKQDADKIFKQLESIDVSKLETIKVSNVNLSDNRASGQTIKVYSAVIDGKTFFVVEETNDNSMNSNVSWDTVDVYSNIYMVK